MSDEPDDAVEDLRAVEERLADTNALLAEWTACSAADSAPLIERLERMGYAVHGQSREAVAEALKRPPTRRAHPGTGRDEAALEAGAGEVSNAAAPIPAEDVTEGDPTRVGER